MKKSKANAKFELTDISKPIFNTWQALYMSFYNVRLYIDIIKHWKGIAWLYLLLLSLILSIPIYISIANKCYHELNENYLQILEKIPTITVKNAVASCDTPMPYLIFNSHKQVRVYIDTNKNSDDKIMQRFPNILLYFAKDGMFVNQVEIKTFKDKFPESSKSPVVFKYFKYMNDTFSGHAFIKTMKLNSMLRILIIMLYLFIVGLIFGGTSFVYFTLSLMAKMICRTILRTYLNYKQVYRLLVVASTPSLLVLDLMLSTHTKIYAAGFVLMCILCTYFCIGVLAYKRESQQLARIF